MKWTEEKLRELQDIWGENGRRAVRWGAIQVRDDLEPIIAALELENAALKKQLDTNLIVHL